MLTAYSAWPAFAISALLVLVFSLPVFRFLDHPPSAHRRPMNAIDGIRGFLALGVVFCHLASRHWFTESGHNAWEWPPSHFYTMTGRAGVAVFFMITGYLFWTKLLDRAEETDWAGLYIGRFLRIVPLYLLVVAIYLGVILVYHRHELPPMAEIVRQGLPWLGFGLVPHGEFITPTPPLNIIAVQTWTLYYEWLFYLSLPVLAVFARRRGAAALCFATLLILLNTDQWYPASPVKIIIEQFLCGMLVGSLRKAYPGLDGNGWLRSLAVLVLGVVAARCADIYTPVATLLLGGMFFFVASGASLFGLLTSKGAQRLGNLSYSLYLMHGAVLVALYSNRHGLGDYAMASPLHTWIVNAVIVFALSGVAIATYRWVELPGIALGRHLAARFAQFQARHAAKR